MAVLCLPADGQHLARRVEGDRDDILALLEPLLAPGEERPLLVDVEGEQGASEGAAEEAHIKPRTVQLDGVDGVLGGEGGDALRRDRHGTMGRVSDAAGASHALPRSSPPRSSRHSSSPR